MMHTLFEGARRRMARLIVSDSAQARIRRLRADPGEFSAELMDLYASRAEIASLDASEVFAVFELAYQTGLDVLLKSGDARICAHSGRAAVEIGFSGLSALAGTGWPDKEEEKGRIGGNLSPEE